MVEKCRSRTVSRILFPRGRPPRTRGRAHESAAWETIIPLAPPLLAESSDLPGSLGRAVRWARREARTRFPIWSCSVRGFACHLPYGKRGALLPHLFTLTARQAGLAVYFLCHCPSGHPDRALPGALPCGVRTFLYRKRGSDPIFQQQSSGRLRRPCQRARTAIIRQFPGEWRTAPASCIDCCGACRSLRRSSRCSRRSHAVFRRDTRVRPIP